MAFGKRETSLPEGGKRLIDMQLRQVVDAGLMTREHAEAVDAYADELVEAIVSGDITAEQAIELTGQRAEADARERGS